MSFDKNEKTIYQYFVTYSVTYIFNLISLIVSLISRLCNCASLTHYL